MPKRIPDTVKPKFLDLVENGWASEDNPLRVGIFIRRGVRPTGRMNPGPYFELTDGKGEFWTVSARSERLRIVGNLLATTPEGGAS
jgi:hypothetical protein